MLLSSHPYASHLADVGVSAEGTQGAPVEFRHLRMEGTCALSRETVTGSMVVYQQ